MLLSQLRQGELYQADDETYVVESSDSGRVTLRLLQGEELVQRFYGAGESP